MAPSEPRVNFDQADEFRRQRERWLAWREDYLSQSAAYLERRLQIIQSEIESTEREQLRLGLTVLSAVHQRLTHRPVR